MATLRSFSALAILFLAATSLCYTQEAQSPNAEPPTFKNPPSDEKRLHPGYPYGRDPDHVNKPLYVPQKQKLTNFGDTLYGEPIGLKPYPTPRDPYPRGSQYCPPCPCANTQGEKVNVPKPWEKKKIHYLYFTGDDHSIRIKLFFFFFLLVWKNNPKCCTDTLPNDLWGWNKKRINFTFHMQHLLML